MIFVKGNLVKLGAVVATAVIIIAVVAALVSGFMTAYKPGNNTTSSTVGYSGGTGGGGATSAVTTPAPTPAFTPGSPGEVPLQAIPEEGMQIPPIPATGQATEPEPGLASGLASPQNLQSPYATGPVPVQQAGSASGAGDGSTQFSSTSPLSFMGGRSGSWFNVSPTVSPPAGVSTPVATPPATTPQPVVMPPALSGPEVPDVTLSPYEYGWRQILLRLLEVLPLMFPGQYPGLQWFLAPSAF